MTTQPEPPRGGPWVKGAFLCETVIEGKDGVNSYVRVIDQITAQGQALILGTRPADAPEYTLPDDLPSQTMITTRLVVMFSAGGALGRSSLQLNLRTPDGLSKPLGPPTDIHFDGRQHSSANLHAIVNLVVKDEGPYAIDVILDGMKRTEVAFEIRYQRGQITRIG